MFCSVDNIIFHPDRLEVAAVIDWELSTLGDPLSDLATNLLPYYLPPGVTMVSGNFFPKRLGKKFLSF